MNLPPKVTELADELQKRLATKKVSDETILITLIGLASKKHIEPNLVAPILEYVFKGDMERVFNTIQNAIPLLDDDFRVFVEKHIPAR